jgi:putative transport protein
MDFISKILQAHVELTIFLTLALGFLLGKIQMGSFKLGPMLGCLFAGMLIGQLHIEVAPVVKLIFFNLFLFATGYKVGPQFFNGLKKEALPQLALTVIICTSCLATAILVSKLMDYDIGTAAGLLAGAFSESTVIGTASDAIQKLDLLEAEKEEQINAIPVAYAVTYLVGTTAVVWFLSSIAPKMLRIDLRAETAKLSSKISGDEEQQPAIDSAYSDWTIRCIKLSGKSWSGKTVSDFEEVGVDRAVIVLRVRKKGQIMDPADDLVINDGDILAVASTQKVMLSKVLAMGSEVADAELMDFPMSSMDIAVTQDLITGKPLSELRKTHAKGVMLLKVVRGRQEIPISPGTILEKGDLLTIRGTAAAISDAARNIGFKELSSIHTDIIFLSLGIFLGGMIGLLALDLGGILITLSTSGGALVMGLVFGWLHAKTPAYGRIPEAALWIFDTMGLAVFLSIVGLSAGPTVISGIQQTGFGIIPAGIVVAVLPHVIGLLAGKYLLKMNPIILLGAQSGAGTSTTGLKAVQDACQSRLPVLGYTIPYALGNIILTAWGPIIVSFMK